jgi:hypothetical protein
MGEVKRGGRRRVCGCDKAIYGRTFDVTRPSRWYSMFTEL